MTQASDVTCDVRGPCAAQRNAPVHALESEASGHVAAVTGDQANDQRDVTSSDQPTEDSSSENLDNIKSVEGDHNELKMETDIEGEFCIQKNPENETSKNLPRPKTKESHFWSSTGR